MQKKLITSFASLAAIVLMSTAAAAEAPVEHGAPARNTGLAANTADSSAVTNPAAEEAATRLVVPEDTTPGAKSDGTASEGASNTTTIEYQPAGARPFALPARPGM